MNNLRKEQIKQLQKEATLHKKAEEVVADVNNLGLEDPEAYADHIFDQLVNDLQIDFDD